jgi:hypothetical protein
MTFKTICKLTCDDCGIEMDTNRLVTVVEVKNGYVSGEGKSLFDKRTMHLCDDCANDFYDVFPIVRPE